MRTPRALLSVPALCLITFGAGGLSTARADEPAPPAPKVLQHLHASGDFIDDPCALSEDGTRLAWITTDGATHARVHLAPINNLADKKLAKDFAYSSITPERIEFLDGDRVLVIDRHPETGVARGEVFGPAGPSKDKLGPATDIALAEIGGTPVVVVYNRAPLPGGKTFTHTLTAYRRDNMKPLGKKIVLPENGEGRVPLPGGPGKPAWFAGGYVTLVALKEGAYDKAKDIRKPDVEAHLDVFAGKLLIERELSDVVAFATTGLIHRKHDRDRAFVRFTDDLKRLTLIDEADVESDLQTPRPLGKYDAQTLASQDAGGGNLYLSLTVDPVNPEAVKAQKADKDWLDVYLLDVKEKRLTEVARVDGQKRPSGWRLAGGRLGVLRKHKGFGRGGELLEIFQVGPEKPAAPAKDAPAKDAPAKEAPAKDAPAKAAPAKAAPAK